MEIEDEVVGKMGNLHAKTKRLQGTNCTAY